MSHHSYETKAGDNGETLYLVGDEYVSEADAAEYAQAEAEAAAALDGDNQWSAPAIDVHSRQAQRILHRAVPGSARTSAYQPSEEDLSLADELLKAGYLATVPGFASLEITWRGLEVLDD